MPNVCSYEFGRDRERFRGPPDRHDPDGWTSEIVRLLDTEERPPRSSGRYPIILQPVRASVERCPTQRLVTNLQCP